MEAPGRGVKSMSNAGAAVVLGALLLGLVGCVGAQPELLTWAEYSKGSPYDWPKVLELHSEKGRLLYFGSRHVYQPDDPQNEHIEELWREFRPTLALNEGGYPPIEPTQEEAIRNHGEAGLVRFLAARDNVPVMSLDPSRTQEVAWLGRKYTPEQVKLFFILRTAAQYVARSGSAGLAAEIERVLAIYQVHPGLMQPPTTYAEVEEAYARTFSDQGAVSDIPSSWFDPNREGTFLNAIARESSQYRDTFIVDLLARHVAEGHRVFAVIGGSHVVVQERRLRWALAAGRR